MIALSMVASMICDCGVLGRTPLALRMSRELWDELTGGPNYCAGPHRGQMGNHHPPLRHPAPSVDVPWPGP